METGHLKLLIKIQYMLRDPNVRRKLYETYDAKYLKKG